MAHCHFALPWQPWTGTFSEQAESSGNFFYTKSKAPLNSGNQNSDPTMTFQPKFKSVFQSMKPYFSVKGRWGLERFFDFVHNINIFSLT